MSAVFASSIAADNTEAARREHAAGPIGAGDLLSRWMMHSEGNQPADPNRK